jgi:hypothetical protein
MISKSSQTPEPFESTRFLAALAAEEREAAPRSQQLQHWCERAAVLAWFEPNMIGAPTGPEALLEDEDWMSLIADCEIVRTAQDGPRRRLRLPKRREALTRIQGREGLKKALLETQDRPTHDLLQQALDRLIKGESIESLTLTQPELYALHTACVWLDGLIDGLPEPGSIALRLRREELLQPHRLLAGPGFVGRKDELDDLRSYVQELPASRIWKQLAGSVGNLARRVLDHPPLVIFGPGGVGKSTLVAQFILEHAEKGDLVFVDLDFGRPNLDPRRPAALLAEAARQISTQVPSKLAEGDALAADLELAASTATHGSLESQNLVGPDEAARRFCRFAASALPEGRNVPFVLDTFEEVEALGQTRVDSVWDLLRQLQTKLPQLRPVICSRIPPPESWALLNLPLHELEPEPAEQYLKDRLLTRHGRVLPTQVLAAAVRRITRTPLALNLAAELLVQAKDAGEDPAGVVAEIKARADEAFLYRRILKQIKDEEVRRLATPGLAVRRLDAGVVLEVLAGPCEVTVKSLQEAEALLERLAGQVALVERQRDGSLLHRPDVRRQMLKPIEDSEGTEVIRRIDRAAAEYYARQPGIVGETERAYHLLRLGDLAAVEPLLTDAVAQRLRGALDELAPDARLVLGLRLGITPGPEELRTADQVRWERGALAAAQDLLASGDYERVLSLLKTGPGRRTGSPLDRIEAEALIGKGDWEGALNVVQSGVAAAQRDGERASALELSLIMARIGFATDDLDLTAKALAYAEALTTATDPAETRFRVLTASIRLARLRNDPQKIDELARRALELLVPATLARLSPSVLRELAGELAPDSGTFGDAAGSILRTALRRLGIEQKADGLIEGLATTISGWLVAGGPGASDVARVLSGISGAPPTPKAFDDREAWRLWLNVIPGSLLGNALATLLKVPQSGAADPHAAHLQGILASYMRDAARGASSRDLSSLKVS